MFCHYELHVTLKIFYLLRDLALLRAIFHWLLQVSQHALRNAPIAVQEDDYRLLYQTITDLK
jgi:hypothetical protein